jgi:hypothetical protein
LLTANGGDVSGAFTVTGIGGAFVGRGGNVTNVAALPSVGGQASLLGGSATGVAGTTATAQGGHVLIAGGVASGANTSNFQGNVAFVALPVSWQAGENIKFYGNCTTEPTGNPTNGIFVWTNAGAGKARGGGGTVTTWAPSHPHCPTCGSDWALEAYNDTGDGWEGTLCLHCLVEEIKRLGGDPNKFMLRHKHPQPSKRALMPNIERLPFQSRAA